MNAASNPHTFNVALATRDGLGQNPTRGLFGQPNPSNFFKNPSNPK